MPDPATGNAVRLSQAVLGTKVPAGVREAFDEAAREKGLTRSEALRLLCLAFTGRAPCPICQPGWRTDDRR